MRTLKDLRKYQIRAINFILTHPKCALFLGMGLGKTVITLTALKELLTKQFARRILIIAPKQVAMNVWKQEIEEWVHLQGLDVRVCCGMDAKNSQQRKWALEAPATIHIINVDNIAWLIENVEWVWDTVVIDESSTFKSHKAKRFDRFKAVSQNLKRCILLTGTPTPNGLIDLWSQIFLLDGGERLGKDFGKDYQKYYFFSETFGKPCTNLIHGAFETIMGKVKDLALTMETKDYLDLPDRIEYARTIAMNEKASVIYKKMEKELVAVLENDTVIDASNAGAKVNKLLQMCNGACYDEFGEYHFVHDDKLETLKEIRESMGGENLLVAYNFKSDLYRLQQTFPDAEVLRAGDKHAKDVIERWNNREIPMLLAHPKSAGHGLNLQHGGSVVVWFGMNWSLELYQQFNARLYRSGQTESVRIIHILASGCIDDMIVEALKGKAKTQSDVLDYFKERLVG